MRSAAIAFALLFGLFGFVSHALAAETPLPPAPTRWVTDNAGMLSESTRQQLDSRLERYEQATGRQVIVYTAPTLGDSPLEEWTAKAFAKWGIGQRGKDNGVALFVFPHDRRMRIEVGYGLEDLLPDAYASRIINEVMAPALKAGNSDAALTSGIDQVLSRLGGETNATKVAPLPTKRNLPSTGTLVIGGFVLLAFLVLLVTHPTMALWLLWSIMSGGRGGGFGGGGGGGGFGGGGGRSGGGGASGGW